MSVVFTGCNSLRVNISLLSTSRLIAEALQGPLSCWDVERIPLELELAHVSVSSLAVRVCMTDLSGHLNKGV